MSVQTIVHAVEKHLIANPQERHRRKKVLESWQVLYDTGTVLPAHYEKYKRSALDIGDKRDLPYLKDVLEFGMEKCSSDSDIVCFTNDDIILHKELPRYLRRHIAIWQCCSSHRCEYHYVQMPSMDAPPADFAKSRERHIGRDLFAFTKRWLLEYWDEIPDFILGASDWDLCLAWLLRLKKGFKCNQEDLMNVVSPCELIPGLVLHEWHRAAWTHKDNVMTSPSQLHNRKLLLKWAKERGVEVTWNWVEEMPK